MISNIEIVGFIATCLSSISQLPQLITIFKTRSTKDLSYGTYITLNIALFVWLIYSFLIHDKMLICANIISLSSCSSICIFKYLNENNMIHIEPEKERIIDV